jgi:hypothetical protein
MCPVAAGLPVRGLGELGVVAGLPEAVVGLFGLATRLGDPWLLLGALAVCYVAADALALDRRRVGLVLAAAFGALGVTLALKAAFALPRPPGAAAAGYGFPSGHALGATVVWGVAALVLDAGRRRTRLAVAAAVVPLVALSRVVIGVHYLVDVVAGVAVGVAVVRAVLALGPGRDGGPVSDAAVARVFGVAVAAGAAALLVRPSPDALLTAGAALGGWVGWRLGRSAAASPLDRRGTAVAVCGLPVVLAGLVAVDAAAPSLPPVVALSVAGGCLALLFALPRVARGVVGGGPPR